MMLALLAVGAVATVVALALFAGMGLFDRADSRRYAARLARAAGRPDAAVAALSIRAQEETGAFGRIAALLLPNPQALRDRLTRTGKGIGLGSYVLGCLVLAGAGFLAARLCGFGLPQAALSALAAGVGLPHLVIGSLIASRSKKFLDDFPAAIDLMVRGVRSGLPITEGIAAVAREMKDPVGPEFARIADAIHLGQPIEAALAVAARRLAISEFGFFVISLAIQRETGGNIGETLSNLSDMLRRRRQMYLKIKAMSAEARSSAVIIGLLPFIIFGVLMVVNRDYAMTLFTDETGLLMLYGALSSLGLGFLVMAKMTRFEV